MAFLGFVVGVLSSGFCGYASLSLPRGYASLSLPPEPIPPPPPLSLSVRMLTFLVVGVDGSARLGVWCRV